MYLRNAIGGGGMASSAPAAPKNQSHAPAPAAPAAPVAAPELAAPAPVSPVAPAAAEQKLEDMTVHELEGVLKEQLSEMDLTVSPSDVPGLHRPDSQITAAASFAEPNVGPVAVLRVGAVHLHKEVPM